MSGTSETPRPWSPVCHCPSYPAAEERHLTYFLGTRWMRRNTPVLLTMQLSRIRTATMFVLSGDCTAAPQYPPTYGTSTYADDPNKNDGDTRSLTLTDVDNLRGQTPTSMLRLVIVIQK